MSTIFTGDEEKEEKNKGGLMDFEYEQMDKKMMQGFNEMDDEDNVVYKRLRKDYVQDGAFYENVEDRAAYIGMLPVFK